jgi:hypothetical protein
LWDVLALTTVPSAGKVKRGDEGDAWGMGFKFPWQKKKEEAK